MLTGSNWAPDLDTPGNAEFVAGFKEAYGRVPSIYAMAAYDALLLVDSAVKTAGTGDREALRAALKAADFPSLRGEFAFSTNNFPVQDFYLTKAIKDDEGNYRTAMVEKVFAAAADGYVGECPMK